MFKFCVWFIPILHAFHSIFLYGIVRYIWYKCHVKMLCVVRTYSERKESIYCSFKLDTLYVYKTQFQCFSNHSIILFSWWVLQFFLSSAAVNSTLFIYHLSQRSIFHFFWCFVFQPILYMNIYQQKYYMNKCQSKKTLALWIYKDFRKTFSISKATQC